MVMISLLDHRTGEGNAWRGLPTTPFKPYRTKPSPAHRSWIFLLEWQAFVSVLVPPMLHRFVALCTKVKPWTPRNGTLLDAVPDPFDRLPLSARPFALCWFGCIFFPGGLLVDDALHKLVHQKQSKCFTEMETLYTIEQSPAHQWWRCDKLGMWTGGGEGGRAELGRQPSVQSPLGRVQHVLTPKPTTLCGPTMADAYEPARSVCGGTKCV